MFSKQIGSGLSEQLEYDNVHPDDFHLHFLPLHDRNHLWLVSDPLAAFAPEQPRVSPEKKPNRSKPHC